MVLVVCVIQSQHPVYLMWKEHCHLPVTYLGRPLGLCLSTCLPKTTAHVCARSASSSSSWQQRAYSSTAKWTGNASALMLTNVGGYTFTWRFIDHAGAWLGTDCKALMHIQCPQYLQSRVHLGSCCPDEAAGPVGHYYAANPLAASVAASGP